MILLQVARTEGGREGADSTGHYLNGSASHHTGRLGLVQGGLNTLSQGMELFAGQAQFARKVRCGFALCHATQPQPKGRRLLPGFLEGHARQERVVAIAGPPAIGRKVPLFAEQALCRVLHHTGMSAHTSGGDVPASWCKCCRPAVRRIGKSIMRPSYRILHGGLRLMECVRLRVKDIDFAQRQLVVRDSEGMEERVTMLPYSLVTPLEQHLLHVKRLHARGLAQGNGSVYVPCALERKDPRVGRQRIWQYAFPSARLSKDLCTGALHRHHVSESTVQKVVKGAA